MKKKLSALLITFTLLLSFIPGCYAAESWSDLSDSKKANTPLKDWTIEFNDNVSSGSVNDNTVYITDSSGKVIPAALSISSNTVNITPKTEYKPGESYYLYISKKVQSTSNKSLEHGMRMLFTYEDSSDKNDDDIAVEFPDPNLEAAVRKEIGKPSGDIYKSDINGVTELKAPESNIESIEGIQYLTSLTDLRLEKNNIKDITPLSDLNNLENLSLYDNQIDDISALSNLTNLWSISIGQNSISDISVLSNLDDLAYLYCHKNNIGDISSLSVLDNLTGLWISHNNIKNITALANLSSLENLDLYDNNIDDISSLSNLTNLTWLYLEGNNISDYSPVSSYYDNLEKKDFTIENSTTRLLENTFKSKSDFDKLTNIVSSTSSRWASAYSSYLVENSDSTISVIDINESVNIETYDNNFNLADSKSIEFELPIFGAFYSGEKYNYIAYGQENIEEDDGKEVIRLVKYDKDFERLDHVSVYGGESFTINPFSAGCGRMSENKDTLVFHTSRKRYTTPDGLNHQSQLTLVVDTQKMKISNYLGQFQKNHVSHSFNQFVLWDGNHHVLVDHGDAYPRSIVLSKQNDNGCYTELNLFDIHGDIGANFTGVSVGGFMASKDNYMVAINSIDHSIPGEYTSYSKPGTDGNKRDIILCTVPKDNLSDSSVKTIKFTDYANTDIYASAPKLVELDGDRFMIIWQEIALEQSEHYNTKYSPKTLKYVIIDGSGNAIGDIQTYDGAILSDCDPVVIDNRVVWYLNQSIERLFYTISL